MRWGRGVRAGESPALKRGANEPSSCPGPGRPGRRGAALGAEQRVAITVAVDFPAARCPAPSLSARPRRRVRLSSSLRAVRSVPPCSSTRPVFTAGNAGGTDAEAGLRHGQRSTHGEHRAAPAHGSVPRRVRGQAEPKLIVEPAEARRVLSLSLPRMPRDAPGRQAALSASGGGVVVGLPTSSADCHGRGRVGSLQGTLETVLSETVQPD